MNDTHPAPDSISSVAVGKYTAMEVKGETLACFPWYIMNKYGQSKYQNWVKSLSEDAQQVFTSAIDKNRWYPLDTYLTEPTVALCDMFFNKSLRGAWEIGRSSADYGLSGIMKILVKLSSPDVLINKATTILPKYYRPSALEISAYNKEKLTITLKITEFPEINRYIEHRIGGWIERAIQICGSKHVTVQIVSSMADGAPITEYRISWKKY